MSRQYCYIWLSCEEGEKESIAQSLLEKRLINCAKFSSVSSMYWWKGQIESANEALVIMESAEDLFDEIETEIAKIHSYDTFVLQSVPVTKINKDASDWMDENLKPLSS
jgi:periplasmic divalent cation tolerance protein